MKAIAFSPSASPAWETLVQKIQDLGITLSPASDESELSDAAVRLGNPPVVVYNPAGSDHVSRVLEWANTRHVWLPVVVLAEESDFSHYQECMHHGASAYYDASAEPERLASIIRQAGGAVVA